MILIRMMTQLLFETSKFLVRCTDNVIMFYVNLFLENIIHIL